MDPFLTLTIITCFILGIYACSTLPDGTLTKKYNKELGVSDEESEKEFHNLLGNAFRSFCNKNGYKGGLGITDFKSKKNEERD